MTIQILNTKASLIVAALVVGLPAAAFGVYEGVVWGTHEYHMSQVHTGHNITYTVSDCQAAPSGDGSKWGATVMVHNGNPDSPDGFKVQIQFVKDGKPVAWSRTTSIGDMEPGTSETLRMEAAVDESGSSQVSCVAVWYRGDSPAGDTSPVPAG